MDALLKTSDALAKQPANRVLILIIYVATTYIEVFNKGFTLPFEAQV